MATLAAITDTGLAAGVSKAQAGIKLEITHYRLGSGVGYVPSRSDTALHGVLQHSGVITDAVRVDGTTVLYSIVVGTDVGNFGFGEVGLYTDEGVLVCLITLDSIFNKIASGSGATANVYELRVPLQYTPDGSNISVESENVVLGRLGEVATFDQLSPATSSATNVYLVGSTPQSDKTLAYRYTGNTLWSFSNYFVGYASVQVKSVAANVANIDPVEILDVQNLGDVIFQILSGTGIGLVRAVASTSIEAGTGRLQLHFPTSSPALAAGDTIQILYNFNRYNANLLAKLYAQAVNNSNTYIPLTQRAAANGVATLDGGSHVPEAQLALATEATRGILRFGTSVEVLALAATDLGVSPAHLNEVLTQKLGNYILSSQRGAANGVATLDAQSKVPVGQLPAAATTDTFNAASQAEMLALPASKGDVVIRDDIQTTFILRIEPATLLVNWVRLKNPVIPPEAFPDPLITSVNGKVGAVSVTAADVGAVPVGRAVKTSGGMLSGGHILDEDVTIDLTAATPEEAYAATRSDRGISPASLAIYRSTLEAKADKARTVTGAGLVKGVVSGNENGTLTVPAATAGDFIGGTVLDAAMTPGNFGQLPKNLVADNGFFTLPMGGGVLLMKVWGRYNTAGTDVDCPIQFPRYFTSPFYPMFAAIAPSIGVKCDFDVKLRDGTLTNTGMVAFKDRLNDNVGSGGGGFYWEVWGVTDLATLNSYGSGGSGATVPTGAVTTTPTGGGGGCVWVEAFVQDNQRFGDLAEGGDLLILDDDRNGYHLGKVITRGVPLPQHCFQLESRSGVLLTVGDSTSLDLQDGTAVKATNMLGKHVAVRDADGFRWEDIVALHDRGWRNVILINAGDTNFAAGDIAGRLMFTHNTSTEKTANS